MGRGSETSSILYGTVPARPRSELWDKEMVVVASSGQILAGDNALALKLLKDGMFTSGELTTQLLEDTANCLRLRVQSIKSAKQFADARKMLVQIKPFLNLSSEFLDQEQLSGLAEIYFNREIHYGAIGQYIDQRLEALLQTTNIECDPRPKIVRSIVGNIHYLDPKGRATKCGRILRSESSATLSTAAVEIQTGDSDQYVSCKKCITAGQVRGELTMGIPDSIPCHTMINIEQLNQAASNCLSLLANRDQEWYPQKVSKLFKNGIWKEVVHSLDVAATLRGRGLNLEQLLELRRWGLNKSMAAPDLPHFSI